MSGGRWVENDARWFELCLLYCDLCGRVIPKRLWQVDLDNQLRTFCDERCEALYRDYVLGQRPEPHEGVTRSAS
jgi:hypothetical protein